MTKLFVKQVKAALLANEVYNDQHHLKKGDPGYRIASHADLVEATGADPNQIKNMLGGVRPGTKVKPVGKSKYVDPICDALGIDRLVRIEIEVPARLADLIHRLASFSEDDVIKLEKKLAKE